MQANEAHTPYYDSNSYTSLLKRWSTGSVPLVIDDATGIGCRERIPILPGLEPILNHADHQRLRHVWQLGTVPVLRPSATHTRFEHSVSVSGLALDTVAYLHANSGAEIAALDLRPLHLAALQCAGLIHDLGHTPLSHAAEDYLYRTWAVQHPDLAPVLNHEALSDIIFGAMVEDDAFKAGPAHVVELWDEPTRLAQLAKAIAWGGKHGSAAAAGLPAECGFLATIVANRFHGAVGCHSSA